MWERLKQLIHSSSSQFEHMMLLVFYWNLVEQCAEKCQYGLIDQVQQLRLDWFTVSSIISSDKKFDTISAGAAVSNVYWFTLLRILCNLAPFMDNRCAPWIHVLSSFLFFLIKVMENHHSHHYNIRITFRSKKLAITNWLKYITTYCIMSSKTYLLITILNNLCNYIISLQKKRNFPY